MMITAAVYPQTMHLQQTVPHFVNFDCSKKKKNLKSRTPKTLFYFFLFCSISVYLISIPGFFKRKKPNKTEPIHYWYYIFSKKQKNSVQISKCKPHSTIPKINRRITMTTRPMPWPHWNSVRIINLNNRLHAELTRTRIPACDACLS